MAHVEKSITVNVPLRTTYYQWSQFQKFPRFSEGVEEEIRLGVSRLHWRATIAG